jgi:hypothetical protein
MAPHEWASNDNPSTEHLPAADAVKKDNHISALKKDDHISADSSDASRFLSVAAAFSVADHSDTAASAALHVNADLFTEKTVEFDALRDDAGTASAADAPQPLEPLVPMVPSYSAAAAASETAHAPPSTTALLAPAEQRMPLPGGSHVGCVSLQRELGGSSKRTVDDTVDACHGDGSSGTSALAASSSSSSIPGPKRLRGPALDFSSAKMLL